MTRFAMLCVPALALLISAQAFSQEPIANRFTMEKTENGFVRMDTLTGEMSICSEKADQLVCRLAADERRAFEQTASANWSNVLMPWLRPPAHPKFPTKPNWIGLLAPWKK